MIIVMGGSGGLGQEVMKLFPGAENWSHDTGVDLTDTASVRNASCALREPVDQLINCAGINRISTFDMLTMEGAMETFSVNALSFVRVVRTLRLQTNLATGARLCNVISNAARIPMTHSLAYNASKAAQEMITRQMARELKQFSIFGVSPNKLKGTGMSRDIEEQVCRLRGWTPEEAMKYQLAALPANVETPPAALAAFIWYLMQAINHPFITGCIFPYGGPQ